MEINAQDVIDNLSGKLAKAESEKSVMEVQIEALKKLNQELYELVPKDEEKEAPLEGELIGG